MSKFVIRPHMRLQEWVAEEKGYFQDEGLDYIFGKNTVPSKTVGAGKQNKKGAYQTFEAGRDADVSCACHWTVNMAASAGHGQLWGEAYSVTPSGIFVAPGSEIKKPEDLANIPVTVGYQSGSHYSTIQGLEQFLEPDEINLHFGGLLMGRLNLLVDGEVPAGNAFGAPMYILEQLGFRKILDTTFMIATMVPPNVNRDDVVKYFKALKRAQADIDLRHDLYTHYFLNELPDRYTDIADTRRFGPGERIVFEPYSKEIFEGTREWVIEREIFPDDKIGAEGYDHAVINSI
jgi:NitT/TauT family transport system substrate-binding protein